MPSFEEIWPSRGPTKRVKRGIEYYLDVRDDDINDDVGVDDNDDDDGNDDKQGPHLESQEGHRVLSCCTPTYLLMMMITHQASKEGK